MFTENEKNVLISVADKTGIVEFAEDLHAMGWRIYASGGTAKAIQKSGILVTDVATMVGESILGHRVVTISRELHAGLLADRLKVEDLEELKSLGLPFFGLVCVDFYPLLEEIHREGADLQSVIEKTDIGGPLMIRSAAKGNRIVVCDPKDRQYVIDLLKEDKVTDEVINALAAKGEITVANYVLHSGMYRGGGKYHGIIGEKIRGVRYGENPWQKGYGLFANIDPSDDPLSCRNWQVIEGDPGHVNWTDVDRMLHTFTHITEGLMKNDLAGPIVHIALGAKHGNCCGAAISYEVDPSEAIKKMLEGNLTSIFGGSLLVNFEINEKIAELLRTHRQKTGRRLLDTVVAPSITPQAREILGRKDEACKMVIIRGLYSLQNCKISKEKLLRPVRDGFLLQENYKYVLDVYSLGKRIGNPTTLILAWAVCATSNSNTTTIAKNAMLLSNGVGQADRLESCKLAVERAFAAGHSWDPPNMVTGPIACTDSFFPFFDGADVLIKAGIRTILGNSGSVRDEEVIRFCEANECELLLVPNNEGRNFFGH